MARVYVGIKAREFLSKKEIELEIVTKNDGTVLAIAPAEKDRKRKEQCGNGTKRKEKRGADKR